MCDLLLQKFSVISIIVVGLLNVVDHGSRNNKPNNITDTHHYIYIKYIQMKSSFFNFFMLIMHSPFKWGSLLKTSSKKFLNFRLFSSNLPYLCVTDRIWSPLIISSKHLVFWPFDPSKMRHAFSFVSRINHFLFWFLIALTFFKSFSSTSEHLFKREIENFVDVMSCSKCHKKVRVNLAFPMFSSINFKRKTSVSFDSSPVSKRTGILDCQRV